MLYYLVSSEMWLSEFVYSVYVAFYKIITAMVNCINYFII